MAALGGLIRSLLFPDFERNQPQPRSPTLREPWRNINWGNKVVDLRYVKEYQTERDDIKHLRILLYGPVGAGKSSFINSVSSVLRGRMGVSALASATTSDKSFTRKYETHKIRKRRGNPQTLYQFVFNDIMGLEEDSGSGVRPEDIKLAMKGHVRENYKLEPQGVRRLVAEYLVKDMLPLSRVDSPSFRKCVRKIPVQASKDKFNPVSPLSSSDPGYNPEPSADDKVHVLVCVLSANSAEITESVLQKMKDIREAASDLGIPQMAMITNIDEACGETEKDLKNVYKSKHLKQKMKDFSAAVGIPMNCIFPVKNYSEEIDMNDDVDTLILSALRRMIDFGDDFINK